MAVTALSGQRWQGSSTSPATATVGSVGSYTTLNFNGTGTFTPESGTTVYYVVVGGGAGGARDGNGDQRGAGGGGAGAYRESSFTAVADTTYTLTVGDGGAGGGAGSLTTACSSVAGEDGDDSSIAGSGLTTITSNGGGYGGGHSTDQGCSGNANGNASGGGGSGHSSGASGGTYGYAGGEGSGTSLAGGGGGGSGSVGANGSTPDGGDGGSGTTPSATYFSSSAIAGGGGGNGSGTTGSGQAGGGDGNQGAIPTPATANTGSGGGASRGYQAGDGGSGVILLSFSNSVAYAITAGGAGTVDEKTTVTDVPAGSHFEETDTRKFYQRFSSTGNTYTWSDCGSDNPLTVTDGVQAVGAWIRAGTLIGTKITKITQKMYRVGAGSGNLVCHQINQSDTGTIKATSSTVAISGLTDSTAYGSATSVDFDFATPVEIAVNDCFIVSSDGSDTKMWASTGNCDSSNTNFMESDDAGSPTFTQQTGMTARGSATYNDEGWRERGTAI